MTLFMKVYSSIEVAGSTDTQICGFVRCLDGNVLCEKCDRFVHGGRR